MSFRARIALQGTDSWVISLATHLTTEIPNVTTPPNLTMGRGRAARENWYTEQYTQVRASVSGYNCFGCCFANRRTALYPRNGAITDRGSTHRNFTKATFALSALYKLNVFERRVRDQGHKEQDAIRQMMGEKDMPEPCSGGSMACW
jgi:hypothetical protein